MKIERTKNAGRNIVFGIALNIYQSAMPFIIRTIMTYYIGVEYLGLSGLFSSVLQVLSLAELGVGSAMIYSMYKPIAENDSDTICALMVLYRKYYRIIGAVVLASGVVLLPFIPALINGDNPADINIYVLYLLNLAATVSSYWMFAYRISILQAHQRQDVISKATLVTDTFKFVLQITVMIVFRSYYGYMCLLLLGQIANNIFTAYQAAKMFPQYKPAGELDKDIIHEINQRIKDLFTAKIGSVIVYSADTIVISAFLGLTVLAIYQNYYSLLSAVMSMVTIIFTACTAGIGNSLVVETKEKNYADLKLFTFIIAWIAGFCSCCFLCLFQPFMELWMGQRLMVEFPIVVCLCVYFFVFEINQLLNLYKDASGMWHEDRFRPLITALSNLSFNLLTVKTWGLYGVILSTVISMLFIGMPWLINNLFTVIFDKKDMKKYLLNLLYYVAVTICVCTLTYMCCNLVKGGLVFVVAIRLGICIVFSNLMFLRCYFRKNEFKAGLGLFDNMTGGKISFIKTIISKLQ